MKYELVKTETGTRVKALIDFSDVKIGDLGGYVESEKNLSQTGNAWVSDNAWVYGTIK